MQVNSFYISINKLSKCVDLDVDIMRIFLYL